MKTLDREFHARLFMKTGWGCHQVWNAWVEAKAAACAEACPDFTPQDFIITKAERAREMELQQTLLDETLEWAAEERKRDKT